MTIANERTHSSHMPASPDAGASLLDELMTADQVAQLLQMQQSTIEDYARRGVLPSVKIGRHRRFVRSQLEKAVLALTEDRCEVERTVPLRAIRTRGASG